MVTARYSARKALLCQVRAGRSPSQCSCSVPSAAAARSRRDGADADRLALADGDRGSVRDRRRASRSSRSTTSRTIRRTRRITKLSGYTPNAEAIAGYKPGSRRRLVRRRPHRRGARQAEDPGAPRAGASTPRRGVRADRAARQGDRQRLAAAAVVAEDEGPDRGDRRLDAEARASRSPSTTSSAPTSTRRPRRRSSARSTRCSG